MWEKDRGSVRQRMREGLQHNREPGGGMGAGRDVSGTRRMTLVRDRNGNAGGVRKSTRKETF